MNNTKKITLGGLLIGLVAIATIAIKIPMPATGGYIHLGDSIIYLAAILFGWKFAAVAGGVGGFIADIISGYSQWAIPTLIIKGVMGLIIGKVAFRDKKEEGFRLKDVVAIIIGGLWMVTGYYFAEGIMVGSLIVPLQSITWNLSQAIMGAVIAFPIIFAILRTDVLENFNIKS